MAFPPNPAPSIPAPPAQGSMNWDTPLDATLTALQTAALGSWQNDIDAATAIGQRAITPVATSPTQISGPVDGQLCYVLSTREYMRYDLPSTAWVPFLTAGADGQFVNTFAGAWIAGDYVTGTIVSYLGGSWLATTATTTSEIPGTASNWASIAASGQPGSNGNTILNGTSNPVSGQGNNGDFFINTTSTTIWGPKSGGAWPGSGTSFIGPTGATGAAGAGVITGGTTGQFLRKNSGTNYDTLWEGIVDADINALASIVDKATDTAVVHLSGTETITGAKTFSVAPVVPSSSFPESAVTGLSAALAAAAVDSTVVHLAGTETVSGAKTFTAAASFRGGLSAPGVTDWFNVKAYPYSAAGNGTTDDTTAINNAITAAAVNGGVVYLPTGTYLVSASLVITGDNVYLVGDGMDATMITTGTGALFDIISTPIPSSSGTVGFTRNNVGVERMRIECTHMTGTTVGKGNGIHFYGTRYSYIRDVNINASVNWSVLLDGDATNFGYNVEVRNCRMNNGSAGVCATFCEANFISGNEILQANATMAANQPAFGTQDDIGYLLRCVSGYNLIEDNIIGSSGTYTSAAVQIENAGPARIIGNRFDQCREAAIRLEAPNSIIIGNQIGNPSSSGSAVAPGIILGSQNNVIIGNQFDITNGAALFSYCISEPAAEGGNVISGNHLVAGVTGTVGLNSASVGNQVHGNSGYNPVGSVTPPAVPATTVTATNNFGTSASVYVVGSTVTVIKVAGVTTGLTGTTTGTLVRVPSGSTVALTYASGTPTWTWFLD